MKINDLLDFTDWQLLTNIPDEAVDIEGVFCGDLLSWVMGNGQPQEAWITVQSHLNIVAVAVLREFACIIICEGVEVTEDVLEKAKEEHVVIISSPLTAYQTAKKFVELGL